MVMYRKGLLAACLAVFLAGCAVNYLPKCITDCEQGDATEDFSNATQ